MQKVIGNDAFWHLPFNITTAAVKNISQKVTLYLLPKLQFCKINHRKKRVSIFCITANFWTCEHYKHLYSYFSSFLVSKTWLKFISKRLIYSLRYCHLTKAQAVVIAGPPFFSADKISHFSSLTKDFSSRFCAISHPSWKYFLYCTSTTREREERRGCYSSPELMDHVKNLFKISDWSEVKEREMSPPLSIKSLSALGPFREYEELLLKELKIENEFFIHLLITWSFKPWLLSIKIEKKRLLVDREKRKNGGRISDASWAPWPSTLLFRYIWYIDECRYMFVQIAIVYVLQT